MGRERPKRFYDYLLGGSKADFEALAVDEEIKALLRALNYAGYRTRSSCAGGVGHDWLTCEVTFQPFRPYLAEEELEEVLGIVRSHTDIPFHLDFEKGPRGGIKSLSIVFRSGYKGEVDLSSFGSSAIMEFPGHPREVGPESSEEERVAHGVEMDRFIKEVLEDDLFWQR